MDNDDRPVGRVLGRREVLTLLATGGLAAASGWRASMRAQRSGLPGTAAPPACVVRPELEEGPFFVDHQLNRSDVRVDPLSGELSAGLPLSLIFGLTQISGGSCVPLAGATVDIWQCDAAGIYSGVSAPGQPEPTSKTLRGFQITDANGRAAFTTIYPGWYQGRAVHIHFKLRTTAAPTGAYEFTSQLFFDDALTDRVHAQAPYNRRARRDTLNRADGIFRQGGVQMLLEPTEDNGRGLAAAFSLGLDLTDAAAGRPDGFGGQGPGRGGRGRGRGRLTGRMSRVATDA